MAPKSKNKNTKAGRRAIREEREANVARATPPVTRTDSIPTELNNVPSSQDHTNILEGHVDPVMQLVKPKHARQERLEEAGELDFHLGLDRIGSALSEDDDKDRDIFNTDDDENNIPDIQEHELAKENIPSTCAVLNFRYFTYLNLLRYLSIHRRCLQARTRSSSCATTEQDG